ncbi:MAG: hypothetical protein D3906_12635, partial [Candidatus Electrothrix sp. AUS1_2]|nr:hypothetical protein [Candidatus Electrothrix sp. AUS1_2]
MNRYIRSCFLSLILVILTGPSGSSAENNKQDILSSYLAQALAHNDTLRAARAKLRATSHKIPQAGVLPDPKVAVQYYLEPKETRTGPQQAALGITQGLPWFGKLALLRELADHDQVIAGAELAAGITITGNTFKVAEQLKIVGKDL